MELELVIIAVVGFMVGYWWRGIMVLYNLSRNPEKMIKMLEEIKKINELEAQGADLDNTSVEVLKKGLPVELEIERVGEHLYAYTKDSNQFIAQGPNLKHLLEEAHKRFPGKVFFGNIPADDPAKEIA